MPWQVYCFIALWNLSWKELLKGFFFGCYEDLAARNLCFLRADCVFLGLHWHSIKAVNMQGSWSSQQLRCIIWNLVELPKTAIRDSWACMDCLPPDPTWSHLPLDLTGSFPRVPIPFVWHQLSTSHFKMYWLSWLGARANLRVSLVEHHSIWGGTIFLKPRFDVKS